MEACLDLARDRTLGFHIQGTSRKRTAYLPGLHQRYTFEGPDPSMFQRPEVFVQV